MQSEVSLELTCDRNSRTELSFRLAAACMAFLFASLCGLAVELTDYEVVKSLVNRYAMADDRYEGEHRASAEVVSRGPEVIPILIRLFHESNDGYYRMSIIGTIAAIEGGKAQLIPLIEAELSKDPLEWRGTTWVFAALALMEEHDTNAARRLALLALRSDDHVSVTGMVLRILDRYGRPQDVLPLQEFAATWRAAGHEGVARGAERAIAEITNRSDSGVGTALETQKSVSGAATSLIGLPVNSDGGREIGGAETKFPNRLVWGMVGLTAVLIIIVVAVRRS